MRHLNTVVIREFTHVWVSNMGLLTFGAVLITVVVFGASVRQNHGNVWADNVCSAIPTLCNSPGWLVGGTIVMALIYFYRVSLHT
jgi:hypothetical protein